MANYYVGSGGNDGNAGTSWALRKLTIQAAVNVATTAGDSVLVGPGTYRETVTMGSSGSAGNVISLIGDYTGTNTSGTKGVVRLTGSNDDISATRLYCIVASGKNYITVRGFVIDGCSSHGIYLTNATYTTVDQCALRHATGTGIECNGASQSNITVSRCMFEPHSGAHAVEFTHSATINGAGHVVENCIVAGAADSSGIRIVRVGGITARNCLVIGMLYGINIAAALAAGQTLTVNNCIVESCRYALIAAANDGTFVENYNVLATNNQNARSNVTAGANSVARQIHRDPRWFFEALNGGRMVTPFDLASYSSIVEYNSGTGAPSTDIRGATAVGTYREWGAAEYSANYRISGPVSIVPIGGIG